MLTSSRNPMAVEIKRSKITFFFPNIKAKQTGTIFSILILSYYYLYLFLFLIVFRTIAILDRQIRKNEFLGSLDESSMNDRILHLLGLFSF